jgi:hypothetical protein
MADSATGSPPLVWRVPPYQPAILLLLVSACAAVNIYGHPTRNVRVITFGLGLLALAFAIAALRMHLVANDDGVAVRHLLRQAWLPWSEVADIEVVDGVRGASTLRVTRRDHTYVDVPPSLLQPTKPTSKRTALAQLDGVVRQLRARRPSRW